MATAAKLFVVTGPSGVGKGTLIRELLRHQLGLELSVSATTREPRPGERDGIDYHFMDEAEFQRRVDASEFIEHAYYSGHRYGTLRSEVESRTKRGVSVVLEIELQGARQIRRAVPEAVQLFIAPPSPQSLRERLESRATDSPQEIERRLEVAQNELAARDEFSHVIVNREVDRAAEELVETVQAELESS